MFKFLIIWVLFHATCVAHNVSRGLRGKFSKYSSNYLSKIRVEAY